MNNTQHNPQYNTGHNAQYGPLVPSFSRNDRQFSTSVASSLDSIVGKSSYITHTPPAPEGVYGASGLKEYYLTDTSRKVIGIIRHDKHFNIHFENYGMKSEQYEKLKKAMEEIAKQYGGKVIYSKDAEYWRRRNTMPPSSEASPERYKPNERQRLEERMAA